MTNATVARKSAILPASGQKTYFVRGQGVAPISNDHKWGIPSRNRQPGQRPCRETGDFTVNREITIKMKFPRQGLKRPSDGVLRGHAICPANSINRSPEPPP